MKIFKKNKDKTGISDGDYDARIEIAKNLLKTKLSKHEILEVTGISIEVLKDLN